MTKNRSQNDPKNDPKNDRRKGCRSKATTYGTHTQVGALFGRRAQGVAVASGSWLLGECPCGPDRGGSLRPGTIWVTRKRHEKATSSGDSASRNLTTN